MTDIYGDEPDNEHPQDDTLPHDSESVREFPSEDEFSDGHSASVAEEHMDETHAVAGQDAGRRSPILPIMAAAGGILLLGAIAWWQFGGTSSNPPSMVSSGSPALSVAPPPPASTVTPKSAAAAPLDLNAIAAGATSSSSNAPIVAPSAATAPSSLAPTPLPSATPSAMVSNTPATNAAIPQSAAPAESVNQRLNTLASRLDDMQKSLDQATQQIGQVTNMLSASVEGPSAKETQDRLDKIEHQLADFHHSTSTPRMTAPEAAAPDTAPVVKARTTHHTASTVKVARKAPVAERTRTPQESEVTTSWVLRAATPGQAWIAVSSTANDLKEVQVGDTLPGIGKVTAITQYNGAWVVQGTKGEIR
jgi:intracellular multiplication protein IcmG